MPEAPMSWTWIAVCLVVGFVLLARGADWLVDGGTALARRIGISTLVVGLTVVAWGTSMPELVVSSLAAWQGDAGISIGNVLGSNIANIGLVLGASAVVLPGVLQQSMRPREVFWLLASLAVLWWFSRDAALTRAEAFALLGVFLAHNLHLWVTARAAGRAAEEPSEAEPVRAPGLRVIAGIAAISIGAYLVVRGAEAGALHLGVNELVVGLTVVAVGTSLPELAAGLGGAFKGETGISLGNVVGSNVFNLLAVLGVVGVLQPLVPGDGPDDALRGSFESALHIDFPMVLAFSVGALVLPWLPGGGRLKGAVLLLGFAAYTAARVIGATSGAPS